MNDDETVIIKIIDERGSIQTEAEVPLDMKIGELLSELKRELKLPLDVTYSAELKRTGERLDNNKTLKECKIKKGDTIRLTTEIEGGG